MGSLEYPPYRNKPQSDSTKFEPTDEATSHAMSKFTGVSCVQLLSITLNRKRSDSWLSKLSRPPNTKRLLCRSVWCGVVWCRFSESDIRAIRDIRTIRAIRAIHDGTCRAVQKWYIGVQRDAIYGCNIMSSYRRLTHRTCRTRLFLPGTDFEALEV